jgi:cell division protein FtsI (penicillin-binding protein 3)/stage V sporulation protein D (sporulation-specific penicillin-binding protein)
VRWNAHTRITLASAFIGLLFTGFSSRLIYIAVAKHDEYSTLAAEKNSIRQPLYAKRGLIFDRNGEVLAENAPIRTAIADGTHIKDARATAELVAPFLEMNVDELTEKLATAVAKENKYVVLRHDVPAEIGFKTTKAMEAAKLHGIYFENDSKRVHPNGSMLCHVMGFLNHERKGVQGIEAAMDDYLSGQDGFRYIERDRTGQELVVYRGQEREPRDGLNVTLTIDMGLQSIVEDELDAAFKEYKPKTAIAIMADPKTGEILAMASRPNYDPDAIGDAQPEDMKNHAVIDMFEPGSVFKIVVASAALNEGLINTETRIFCENGRFAYGGKILRDHHGYGMIPLHDILMHSSNIGSAKLALMEGEQTFYDYIKRFGFGERTGIELPGEITGLTPPPARWDKLSITRMPMGQAVAVTPLQTVQAYGVIANGGKLIAQHLVKSLSDSSGKVIREFKPAVIREVINPETASIIRSALTDVVSPRGTAVLASVPGFRVAGKTGTAQIAKPGGGYYENKYLASFIGIMPADDPAFVCLVMVEDPKVGPEMYYGGLVAAPVFSRIAERAARYLDLQPVMKAEPVTQVAANHPEDKGDARDQ